MNLAILHYHLEPGGVTRVIENHLAAIDAAATRPMRVALLHGGRCSGWPDGVAERFENLVVSLHAVAGLDYDDRVPVEPASLEAALRAALADVRFTPGDTVLHVHNHALGKNLSLPVVLASLAREWPLLLQIHDFAEDFRPSNYRRLRSAFGSEPGQAIYPQAPQIHYAVLNGRDRGVLEAAGVATDRLHHVPNPVVPPSIVVDRDAARARIAERLGIECDDRFVFSPVRGIRRKNLGETILLSMLDDLDGRRTVYGVARAPINPAERPGYDRWTAFAIEPACRMRFGTAEVETGGVSFAENLAAADAAVTTSVAEGFGMAFLEPWLAGLPLVGRNLPSITSDFRDAGVRLDGLYDRLAIPVEWVGHRRFAAMFQTAGTAVLESCERPTLSPADWSAVVEGKIVEETVDFADLDETLQEVVLRRVAASVDCRHVLHSLNPNATQRPSVSVIDENRERIAVAYAPRTIGTQILAIYDQLRSTPIGPVAEPSEPQQILDRFLDLTTFRPIRGV